jgi:hypothetical protein
MTLEQVKTHYKTSYNFQALTGMSRTNLSNWKRMGYIPLFTQHRLEQLTKRKLKATVDDTRPS